ncbi:MAG: LysM peptidoglycan-binding domain-containing protein [Candidatus Omnitrophica bacterium]|nr:LysM peptidoglycan-binding domain-containing protein [Candidatus Omnitrophota bacterium]
MEIDENANKPKQGYQEYYREPVKTTRKEVKKTPKIEIPALDTIQVEDEDPSASSSGASGGSYIEYVIQKDDTLQKISKKFYDSYSKWTKIYEANKNVIKSPDRIAPGTTIRIPQ